MGGIFYMWAHHCFIKVQKYFHVHVGESSEYDTKVPICYIDFLGYMLSEFQLSFIITPKSFSEFTF